MEKFLNNIIQNNQQIENREKNQEPTGPQKVDRNQLHQNSGFNAHWFADSPLNVQSFPDLFQSSLQVQSEGPILPTDCVSDTSENINEIKSFQKSPGQKGQEQKKIHQWVFKEASKRNQYKNVARFFARMIRENAEKYLDEIPDQIATKIKNDLNNSRQYIPGRWNLQQFMNNNDYGTEVCRKNRKSYNQMLKKYTIEQMQHPKSQIKSNRVQYLRVAKVLALRCRNKYLIGRFQAH